MRNHAEAHAARVRPAADSDLPADEAHHISDTSKMKLLLLLSALALSGCASNFRLPAVAGKSVHYERKDTFGGTVIDAKGVAVTADKILAEEVIWTTTYPQFSVSLHVIGYEQQRRPKPSP